MGKFQRERRRLLTDNADKGVIVSTMMLMGVGWQLGTAMPASADQRDEPPISQSQSMNDETDQVEIGPITDQSTPTTDDDGDVFETTQELVTTALTPNTPVDQPAIARAADQVTSAPEVGDEPTQSGKPSTDASTAAVVPTVTPTPDPVVAAEQSNVVPYAAVPYDDRTIDEWMPNKTLQAAVLATLKDGSESALPSISIGKHWERTSDITQQDMFWLTDLSLTGGPGASHRLSTYIDRKTDIDGKIEFSLKGLEYATSLESIAMSGGGTKYQPFQMHGDIVDISPLAYLSNLKRISLRNNRIEDISPIQNVSDLDLLILDYNHIADFSPLKGLKKTADTRFDMQYAILPPIKVDPHTRKYHMFSPIKLYSGETVGLTPLEGDVLTQEIEFHLFDAWHGTYGKAYYHTLSGANISKGESNHDLWFQNIPDQKPGDKDPNNKYQVALPDYYYLIAEANILKEQIEGGGKEDEREGWYVIQPYTIGQAAGTVTVRYQDQSGKTIAPDKKLAQGFVDDDYDAKDLAVNIEGYTLQEPLPDNAKGKYTEGPIEITYIYQQDQVRPGGTQPPVSGVTPPVPTPVPSTPEVTPPASSEKPVPAPVPPVTAPTEMVRPETPKPAVTPEPVVHQAGAASAVAPVTPVDHGGVSDAVAVASPMSQQQPDSHGSASQQLILPQTNQRQSQLAWLGGWGLLVGIVGVIWHRRKRE